MVLSGHARWDAIAEYLTEYTDPYPTRRRNTRQPRRGSGAQPAPVTPIPPPVIDDSDLPFGNDATPVPVPTRDEAYLIREGFAMPIHVQADGSIRDASDACVSCIDPNCSVEQCRAGRRVLAATPTTTPVQQSAVLIGGIYPAQALAVTVDGVPVPPADPIDDLGF